MRSARALLGELVALTALAAVGGSLRALRQLADALLRGEALAVVGMELAGLSVCVGVVALAFSGRPGRLDAAGATAGAAALVAIEALGLGLFPEGGPGLALLLALVVGGRLLGGRLPWVRLPVGLVAAASAFLLLPAARTAPGEVPAGGEARHLVLVTLDTFRADHLGAIGGSWFDVQTPALDALAGRGLLFTQGVAPAPLTLPSHASMLTGGLPEASGITQNGRVMDPGLDTIARRLASAGWTTGAFVSSAVLGRDTGIDQGFHHFDDAQGQQPLWLATTLARALDRVGVVDDRAVQRRGDQTVDRALRWLERQDGSVFLWVHLYDPHSGYRPPPPYDTLYDPAKPGLPGGPDDVVSARRRSRRDNPLFFDLSPRDLRPYLARYAGEITWTDRVAGRLLDALDPQATVLVAADHGESLVEHDYLLNHGWQIYQPSIQVPIILAGPGIPAGVRDEQPVPLLSVTPTLLQLAGLPATGSLLDRHTTPSAQPETLRLYGVPQQARRTLNVARRRLVGWRLGDTKWIVNLEGEVELYDLHSDPDELVDLAADHPERDAWARRGVEELARLKAAKDASRRAVDQEEALRILGYVDD